LSFNIFAASDISERKQMEKDLQDAQAKLALQVQDRSN